MDGEMAAPGCEMMMDCDWISVAAEEEEEEEDSLMLMSRNKGRDAEAGAAEAGRHTLQAEFAEENTWSRPIVVGYAFGPKKMSTMGVVMAEASKAKLTTAPTNAVVEHYALEQSGTGASSTAPPASVSFTPARGDNLSVGGDIGDPDSPFPVPQSRRVSSVNNNINAEEVEQQESFVFTMDLLNGKESNVDGGLQNIVRHFRSSCSSVGSMNTAVTANSTLTSKTRTSGKSFASSGRLTNNTCKRGEQEVQQRIPVRVSFVPLDPGEEDYPAHLFIMPFPFLFWCSLTS